MLVNVKQMPMDPTMMIILGGIGDGVDPTPRAIIKGVYEISHFSFNHATGLKDFEDCYPTLKDEFSSYGVCDDYQQVLEQCPEIIESSIPYAISVTPIRKSEQSDWGGWRWHKWGPYIGKQEPTTEYLYDEPVIEQVYCYHIYRIPQERIER